MAAEFGTSFITIRTLARYLGGNREAILEIAADRRGLWLGLPLVFSAALAREYDGQDLLHEPWYLLVPLVASLAVSFPLFVVTCGRVFIRGLGWAAFFAGYRAFLTLFWMTAPLAWLYAIPYERFLSPGLAAEANLWTLGLVALWRVAIMVKCVSVITGRSLLASLFMVMAVADVVAIAAIVLMPKPIFQVMGGIRLTETESAIQGATFMVSMVAVLSAPVWLLGAAFASFSGDPVWQVPASRSGPVSGGRGMWLLAALSLLVWLPILPGPQAEQRLRWRVETDMKAGKITDSLNEMSAHSQSDFPPNWDPPPREAYGESSPRLLDVMSVLMDRQHASWVREAYVEKLRRRNWRLYNYRIDPAELEQLAQIAKRLPEGPSIAYELRDVVKFRLSAKDLTEAERESIAVLLKLAAKGQPDPR